MLLKHVSLSTLKPWIMSQCMTKPTKWYVLLVKTNQPGPSCSKRRQLNELVKGHFVNCFSRFNIQYSDIFCWKNVSSFCTAKATHIFSAKNFSIFAYHDVNFNELLTNDTVSFEQLGPGHLPSLIRVFAVHSMGSQGPKLHHADCKDWSDWADAQADLSLRWGHVILMVLSCTGSCDQHKTRISLSKCTVWSELTLVLYRMLKVHLLATSVDWSYYTFALSDLSLC